VKNSALAGLFWQLTTWILRRTQFLKYYKGQQSVERGFRFLKDKSFRVVEEFLKKESRIEALSMIMVLCFVYAAAGWYVA
jgi:transposase